MHPTLNRPRSVHTHSPYQPPALEATSFSVPRLPIAAVHSPPAYCAHPQARQHRVQLAKSLRSPAPHRRSCRPRHPALRESRSPSIQARTASLPGRAQTAARRPWCAPQAQCSPAQTAERLQRTSVLLRSGESAGKGNGSCRTRKISASGIGVYQTVAPVGRIAHANTAFADAKSIRAPQTCRSCVSPARTKRADLLRSLPRPSFNQFLLLS